jgi:hypothetical protein
MINNTVDGTFHPSDECRGASLDLHWLCTTHAGRDILLSTSSLNRWDDEHIQQDDHPNIQWFGSDAPK